MIVKLWSLGVAIAAEPTDLELAYQREFAYLQTERSSLGARLDRLDRDGRERADRAESEIADLQARLLGLRSRRAALEDQLGDALREADGLDEAAELVESTLFQAQSTLSVELPEAEDAAAQVAALERAWTLAGERVERSRRLRVEAGSWFDGDGTRREGDVLRVGDVAAYGLGSAGGALIPVGEGKLQLRDDDGAGKATAARLADGRPGPVSIFLFENPDRRIDEAPAKTWWTLVEAGGVVGVVILVLGAVAALLAVLRTLSLWNLGRGTDAVRAAMALVDAGRWAQAEKLVRTAPGAGPRVLRALLPIGPGDRRRLEDRASEALLLETPAIDRFGAAILVIAAVAPLLGLLGTVTGMIGTFEIITEFGTGDPRMLSGGISEALVTTQFGLVVAIPALLVGNLLNRRAEGVMGQLELAAIGVVNRAEGPFRPVAPPAPSPAPAEGLAVAHG